VKRSAEDGTDVPAAVVTVTSTVPATLGGTVAVMEVSEVTVKDAGLLPKETADACVKPVPVIVIVAPPPEEPVVALRAVTVVAAA
jgi:hypothetical protein